MEISIVDSIEWKEICHRGYSYLVSSEGDIKCWSGESFESMEISVDSKGYKSASGLCGDQKLWVKVHSMVALAFIGETPKKKVIIHNDFDRGNNNIDNLDFATKNQAIKRWHRRNKLNKLLDGGIWKPIKGFKDYMACSDGRILSKRALKYLKPTMKDTGYFKVGLTSSGKNNTINIHRIIANTFLGSKPEGMKTIHIDGDRANNSVSNLKYVEV